MNETNTSHNVTLTLLFPKCPTCFN